MYKLLRCVAIQGPKQLSRWFEVVLSTKQDGLDVIFGICQAASCAELDHRRHAAERRLRRLQSGSEREEGSIPEVLEDGRWFAVVAQKLQLR